MRMIRSRSKNLDSGITISLSAEVAILAQADLLLILTSVEGLLDEQKRLIPKVVDIDAVTHLASEKIGAYLHRRNGDETAGGQDGFSSRDSQRHRERIRPRGYFRRPLQENRPVPKFW